jgi:hypothetical protein
VSASASTAPAKPKLSVSRCVLMAISRKEYAMRSNRMSDRRCAIGE